MPQSKPASLVASPKPNCGVLLQWQAPVDVDSSGVHQVEYVAVSSLLACVRLEYTVLVAALFHKVCRW